MLTCMLINISVTLLYAWGRETEGILCASKENNGEDVNQSDLLQQQSGGKTFVV